MTFSPLDRTDATYRKYKIAGQNHVIFRCDPQFGFWSVAFEKGGMAEALSGSYTSFRDLYNKTNEYLKTREKFKTEIGEEVEVY